MQRHVCLSHTQLSIKTVGKKAPILNRAHYIFSSYAHWMALPVTSWCFYSPDFHVTMQTTFMHEVFKEHCFSLPVDDFHRIIKIGNDL